MVLQTALTGINLGGYGSSKGFIGYFERSGRYQIDMEDAAIRYFLEFIKQNIVEYSVYSSIFININEVLNSDDEQLDRNNDMVISRIDQSDIMRIIDFDKLFGNDYSSEEYISNVENLWNQINVCPLKSLEVSAVFDLIKMKMTMYGLYGHLFIVSEKLGVAFYPHDDIGFGVISLNSLTGRLIGIDFLKGAESLEGFRSSYPDA